MLVVHKWSLHVPLLLLLLRILQPQYLNFWILEPAESKNLQRSSCWKPLEISGSYNFFIDNHPYEWRVSSILVMWGYKCIRMNIRANKFTRVCIYSVYLCVHATQDDDYMCTFTFTCVYVYSVYLYTHATHNDNCFVCLKKIKGWLKFSYGKDIGKLLTSRKRRFHCYYCASVSTW